mmetsp:Transcript_8475/g.6316  ORF Transcript_8475/g.6316 Transcript_8475/m.6316 type:complete len:170 (+) Transcript_8475:245-754(+)
MSTTKKDHEASGMQDSSTLSAIKSSTKKGEKPDLDGLDDLQLTQDPIQEDMTGKHDAQVQEFEQLMNKDSIVQAAGESSEESTWIIQNRRDKRTKEAIGAFLQEMAKRSYLFREVVQEEGKVQEGVKALVENAAVNERNRYGENVVNVSRYEVVLDGMEMQKQDLAFFI